MGAVIDRTENTPLVDPTTARTFPELIRAMTDAYGDKPAVVLGEEVLTYKQLDEQSARLAGWLMTRGVGKATRVGLLYANSGERREGEQKKRQE